MYAIVNTFHDYTAVSDSSGIMKSDSKHFLVINLYLFL